MSKDHSADELRCPNCDSHKVITYTADQHFPYGVEELAHLIARDVETFQCLKCNLIYTGEDGEKKRQAAVDAYVASKPAT